MKKIVLGSLVVLTGLMLTGCGCAKKEKKKVEEVTESEVPTEVFQFLNSDINYEDGKTKIVTTVENIGKKEDTLKEVKITVNDLEGNLITELSNTPDVTIKPNEKKEIEFYYDGSDKTVGSISYMVVR